MSDAMIAATLLLALGATLLVVFRLSGSPVGAGVVVFLGAWLVATACAMQLGAIVDRVAAGSGWRIALKVTAWIVTMAATAWAIAQAPGLQLLMGLLIAPVLVGVTGVVAARRDGWPAVPFALVALALSVLLIPAALERLVPP
jgi:hypothetical protein